MLLSSVLTPRSFVPNEEKRAYVDQLLALEHPLAPERYGFWEPLRKPFVRDAADAMVDGWGTCAGFFCTRRKPHVDIDATTGFGGVAAIHGNITIRAEAGRQVLPALLPFAVAESGAFSADLAFVHVLAEQELAVGMQSETVSCYSPRTGKHHIVLTTHDLRRYLPQLYWATVFGPAYVTLFGKDRLLSAPAPVVRELEYGAVYIQLSASPFDFVDDYERLESVRLAVKEHLGANAFFDADLPRHHKYDVPQFHLDSEKWYRAGRAASS